MKRKIVMCVCVYLLVPLLFRPSNFPGGDKIGLDADDDDACWMMDGVRVAPKCGGVCCACKCDWCNECNFGCDIEPVLRPDTEAPGAWWWWWWCNWWISERLVKETPSSGWLLCTITLLLVAWVWCDVDDGWPPEISIIFSMHNSQQTIL